MRISVIGTGYVGLVAGACFSDSGNHVTCLDVNEDKIRALKAGEIPIFEPGLAEIVHRNVKGNRLFFTTDTPATISNAEIIFCAVGTPTGKDGALDLKYVMQVADAVKAHAKGATILVMKSTVPVGTADKVRARLEGATAKIDVVSNPEFLKEGTAVDDFLRPDRVVIGAQSEQAQKMVAELYAPYTRSGKPILLMSNRSAEVTKYAANTLLAARISFINEVANLCERVGAEVHDVRRGLITDSRIGAKFLYPGCGYGGSCFPKDVQALIALGREHDIPMDISTAAHNVNERQKEKLFEKLLRHYDGKLEGKTIAIWGLAFKPMTDDMREAPAVTLIRQLQEVRCKIQAYDPAANEEARHEFKDTISLYNEGYEALKGADALVIMTEWNEFRSPDFDRIKSEIKDKVIFDGRNVFELETLARVGITYYCIGKPDPK